MRENRVLLLTLSIIFICTIIGYVLYTLFGHPLIRAMYEGRSIEILNRMIEGQAISPVERYYETGDSLFTRFLIFIFCVFISLIIVVKPLISHIYLAVLNTIDFWLQHKIILLLLGTFISITVLVYIAIFILQDFPNSSDEYNYIMQAKTILAGRFWNKPHPLQEFFKFTNIIEKDGKLVNISAPGWPLALAVAMLFKVPLWFVNPILGTLSLLVIFLIGKKLYDEKVALLSVFVTFVSSFFLLNSASYFPHTLASLLVLFFVYFGLIFIDEEKPRYVLLMGIFFGLAFITRYCIAFGVVFVLALYFLFEKPKFYKKILWFFIGAAPFIIFLFLYNYNITGNFLLVPGFEDYRRLWFYPGFLTLGLKEHLLQLFNFMKWTPLFLLWISIIYLPKSFKKVSKGYIEFIFWFLVLGSIFFIPSSIGNEYGPRYYYEGFPFLVLFTISNLFKEDFYYKKNDLSKFLLWLFILSLILNVPMLIGHLRIEREVVWGRKDLYRLVEKEKIKNAIIFLNTGSGAIRQMPIGGLTQNDIDYSNSVLYVWDRGEDNKRLMGYYLKRGYYTYSYDRKGGRGSLTHHP